VFLADEYCWYDMPKLQRAAQQQLAVGLFEIKYHDKIKTCHSVINLTDPFRTI